MLTTDKQSQDLHQIAGVQDLSHENAAAVSGGVAFLGDGLELRGERRVFTDEARSLGSLNNITSSILISPGRVWRFWTGQNFSGASVTLAGGARGARLFSLEGSIFNNNIESAQPVR